MSDRLWPLTWPSVETQTSTFEVGDALSTLIVFGPGFRVVAGVSTVVSSSDAGVGVCDERISTAVPVLFRLMVTSPILVGLRQLQHQADAVLEVRERHRIRVGVDGPYGRRIAVDGQPGLVRRVGLALG